jgi:hypothetical protein
MAMKRQNPKAHHKDTKRTKLHQEKQKSGAVFPRVSLCSWCLRGEISGFITILRGESASGLTSMQPKP